MKRGERNRNYEVVGNENKYEEMREAYTDYLLEIENDALARGRAV